MKVIKRDGRAVDYNKEKIEIAIEKANKEVRPNERATKEEIKDIIKYIEELDKKRILVEDIQDIIEQKLMEKQRFLLAKKYIVYRYTRALVRKQNTTDASILGLIKKQNNVEEKSNNNIILASKQRDYIAGEVSKDLTKRMLLPEKITKAHEDGILYFHDADYFLQPIFNSSIIKIGDMLDNGTVINGKKIESPKTFQVACIVASQIIATVASNQYGEQTLDVKHFGKYLRKSYMKYKEELEIKYQDKLSKDMIEDITRQRVQSELELGVQLIQYQINTLMTTNGKSPSVTLLLNIDEKGKYAKENAVIIEEILKQTYKGIKNEEGILVCEKFPKLVYVLCDENCLKGGKYDYITNLAIKCSNKCLSPSYISEKKLCENYEGKFNQGVVSINLSQIGIIADGDEEKFWDLLDERLELCHEALMCRYYALVGTISDTSPIHWKYGAISRLKSKEKIDELLKCCYSSISLGYVGINEATKIMKGEQNTTKEGYDFEIKVMKRLQEKTKQWKKETGLGFELCETLDEYVRYELLEIDKEKFGIINGINDKTSYTTSCLNLSNIESNKIEEIVRCTYENNQEVKFEI